MKRMIWIGVAVCAMSTPAANANIKPGGNASGNRFILCNDGTHIMWPSLGVYKKLAAGCNSHNGVASIGDNSHPNGGMPPPSNMASNPNTTQVPKANAALEKP